MTLAELTLAIALGLFLHGRLGRHWLCSTSEFVGRPDGRAGRASVTRMSLQPALNCSRESASREPRVLDVAALGDHFQRLYRAAYALCRSQEDAEDLVQETYARVLRRPRLLRRDDDIVYLLRVLRNTWISQHRAASARLVASDLAEIEFIADPREDAAIAALELKAIYAAIKDLPEPLRETVVAVDVVGLSYRQAARALGTKQGTIMSRLYRARERLASQLDAPSR